MEEMPKIPKWLKTAVSVGLMSCHHCETGFSLGDVRGIVSGPDHEKNQPTFLVQLYCRECQESRLYYQGEMTASHIDRAMCRSGRDGPSDSASESEEVLFDGSPRPDVGDKSHLDRSPPRRRVRITRKDVKEHREFLDSIETHDEMLNAMGISQKVFRNRKKSPVWVVKGKRRSRFSEAAICRNHVDDILDRLKQEYSCDILAARCRVLSGGSAYVPTELWIALEEELSQFHPNDTAYVLAGIAASPCPLNGQVTLLRIGSEAF